MEPPGILSVSSVSRDNSEQVEGSSKRTLNTQTKCEVTCSVYYFLKIRYANLSNGGLSGLCIMFLCSVAAGRFEQLMKSRNKKLMTSCQIH